MTYFVSALGWLMASIVAGLAVFSPTIRDTLLERIGLCALSTASLGAAYRIIQHSELPMGGASLSIAVGLYSFAVLLKHVSHLYSAHPIKGSIK